MARKNKEKIEKPEDKIWREWFNKLSNKDHEQYMGKLGLTKDDLQELDEVKQEMNSPEQGENWEAGEKKTGAKGKKAKGK